MTDIRIPTQKVSYYNIWICLPLLIYGLLSDQWYSYFFVLPYLSSLWLYEEKLWYIGVIFYSAASFYVDIYTGYIHLLYCFIQLLCIRMIQLYKNNSYGYIPIINAVCILLFSLYRQYPMQQILLLTGISYFDSVSLQEERYKKQERILNNFLLSHLLFSFVWYTSKYIQYIEPDVYYGFFLLFTSRCISVKRNLLFIIVLYFMGITFNIWMMAGMISLLLSRQNRIYPLLIYILIFCMTPFNIDHLYFLSISGILYLLIPFRNFDQYSMPQKEISSHLLKQKKELLSSQMNQFISIFQLLGKYKEEDCISSSYFYATADTLKHMIRTMENASLDIDDQYHKIMDVLNGYQYEILYLDIHYTEEGNVYIRMQVMNMNPTDETEVILPVLKVLVDKKIQLISCHKEIFDPCYVLEFAGPKPYKIHTDTYKLKTKNPVSGDSYSVFRQTHATICMISDGMGSGEKAKKISQMVIELFERMIAAEMNIETAISCINQLIQSKDKEQYATLDLLLFDELNHDVYIVKSGACPTYCYRDNVLYCLSIEALPLGILEEVTSQVYRMKCQKEDIYLLVSDGIEPSVIELWFNEYGTDDVKERIEQYIQSTNPYLLKDDATVLVAKVE